VLEPPAEIDGNLIVVAGTLGIAMFPEHGENAESLLRRSDVALYVAKHIQNDFSVYDPAYDSHSVKQLALKAELRTAIEEDQLVLFYQPKLDLEKGCVTSVEALVRWQHPERGMIPPDQFIPLSEQRGLIGPLTEWVIREALRQYTEWQKLGLHLQIAVNLSSRVLYDLSLPNKIEKYLINYQLPPGALSLEITEEATMIDPERAMNILNRLDEMGVSLSIDDFGTGHSSLSYLKRLPVDEIKIDRSFVMEMEESDSDAKIVHATIDLSHNLGLKVVAEGVETVTALKMLKSLNCDYAQGYYLSRPVPAAELCDWLNKSGYSCNI
jgi:EAL domain-containing protein (putative c-di-GMP-specific phosphodiesterase class I)